MRLAVFIGNDEVKRLANGLIGGIAEHRRRAAAPVADDTQSVGENYHFGLHVVTSNPPERANQTIRGLRDAGQTSRRRDHAAAHGRRSETVAGSVSCICTASRRG
jgi:hypothetical protein